MPPACVPKGSFWGEHSVFSLLGLLTSLLPLGFLHFRSHTWFLEGRVQLQLWGFHSLAPPWGDKGPPHGCGHRPVWGGVEGFLANRLRGLLPEEGKSRKPGVQLSTHHYGNSPNSRGTQSVPLWPPTPPTITCLETEEERRNGAGWDRHYRFLIYVDCCILLNLHHHHCTAR